MAKAAANAGSTLALTESDARDAWEKTKKRCKKEEKILRKLISDKKEVTAVAQIVDEAKKLVEMRIKFHGDGLYKGKDFGLKIVLPSGYPFQAPANVSFLHEVYHPSVDPESKDICPHVLGIEEWKPTQKLLGVVQSMRKAMETIPVQGALNADAAQLFEEKPEEFKKKLAKELKKKAA